MAQRHLLRSIVLQTLFEWDVAHPEEGLRDVLLRNAEEFGPGVDDISFMERLLDGVIAKQKDIDLVIEKAAPDWPIERIAPADRNILRIGLYELLFADHNEVPPKVAINEAIELAKSFGGESSGKFVNGVLGSVYKELGEPGKDQTSRRKKDVPYEEMPIEKLGGAVVYAKKEDDIYLALVHDVFGRWTLSKGGIENGTDVRAGTREEIKSELGIDVSIAEELGTNEYIASHPEKGKMRKQVTYFLAEAPFQDLTLGTSGGLDDAKWFKLSEVVNLNTYDDILPIITKAVNILLGNT